MPGIPRMPRPLGMAPVVNFFPMYLRIAILFFIFFENPLNPAGNPSENPRPNPNVWDSWDATFFWNG